VERRITGGNSCAGSINGIDDGGQRRMKHEKKDGSGRRTRTKRTRRRWQCV